MSERRTNEALEKLNQGIQESKQMVQQRTMKLAQGYFNDSTEEFKQQINESRATLEGLPDQIPGGREEAFQVLFQELMDNYSRIEDCLNEAQENVANLDTEQIRKQGEVDATDAARRQARELGVDLTEIEGTGTGGRITVDDVKNWAVENGAAGEEPEASDAARHRAEELGIDLSEVEGTGFEGNTITVKDVEDFAAERTEGPKATDAARRDAEEYGIDLSEIEGTGADGSITVGDVTEYMEKMDERTSGGTDQATQRAQEAVDGATRQAQDIAGEAAGRAQESTDGAARQAQGVLGQVGQTAQLAQETAGGAVQQAQDTADQTTGQASQQAAGEPKVTSAARRKAKEMGVDLSKVEGTGSGGLITIKDVMEA